MDTRPFTKSQIFSLLWMAIVVAYLFAGTAQLTDQSRLQSHSCSSVATVFSLFTLGRRFPMFGLFLLMVITSLMSGGRGRRRW